MTRSKLLVLGGTTEASALCRHLLEFSNSSPILSLAGRTKNPVLPAVPVRIGGFGGSAGLERYLREEKISLLVDATHPFAARISRHAGIAAAAAEIPLLTIMRPPWRPEPGDHWTEVADPAAAAEALGQRQRRVFLTIGRQDLAPFARHPQHRYVIRSVDAPDEASLPPEAKMITARGPFDEAAETACLRDHAIEVLVTKNSGGMATYPKLAAARRLGIAVIIVSRPPAPDGDVVPDITGALAWLAAHAGTRPRGV